VERFAAYGIGVLFVWASLAWAEPPLHPILEPEFQCQLSVDSNSVLTYSDEIKLLVDGKQSYPERWRMLEDAKERIYISTMYIFRDETANRLRDTLIRKKAEGVDVRLIVYGPYKMSNCAFYRAMRTHGIDLQMYGGFKTWIFKTPLQFLWRHLHDKIFVVDGQEAIVGGMNWSSRYARGGTDGDGVAWRDTDILVTGEQARIIEVEFLKRWNRGKSSDKYEQYDDALARMREELVYPVPRDYSEFMTPNADAPGGWEVDGLTRFLYQQPAEDDCAYMTEFFKHVIDKSQSHVYWQSISMRPSRLQKRMLLDAAARGVDVRLLTNSWENMKMLPFGGMPVYIFTRAWYKPLLKGGVRIFEYHGPAALHAKAFVADDVVAVIGSYNATVTSSKYYTEAGIVTYDTESIQDIKEMFSDDFAHSKEVTLETLKRKD